MRRSPSSPRSIPEKARLRSCDSLEDSRTTRLRTRWGYRAPPSSGTGRWRAHGCTAASLLRPRMTPERWRTITEIFHAARAYDAVRRDAFLSEVCAADLTLRGEVDSLIAADDQAGRFGDTPITVANLPL